MYIRAGSDLWHDVQYIGNIDKFHSKLVYVGLAQARPNNTQLPSMYEVKLGAQMHPSRWTKFDSLQPLPDIRRAAPN